MHSIQLNALSSIIIGLFQNLTPIIGDNDFRHLRRIYAFAMIALFNATMLKSVVFQTIRASGHSVISSPKLGFDRMSIKKSQLGKVKKFRKVVFKLSDRQRSLVERCARYERTTPNKFIKSAISNRVEKYAERIEEEDRNKVSENQLALFNFSNEGVQTSLFD